MIKVKPITNKDLRKFAETYPNGGTACFQAIIDPPLAFEPIFHFSPLVPDDCILYGEAVDKIVAHRFLHFVPGRHKGFIAAENLRTVVEQLF